MLDTRVLDSKPYALHCIRADALLGDAAQRMVEEDISCLVVVDRNGFLVGILSRSDLIRVRTHLYNWASESIGTHMSKYVVTVAHDATLRDVARCLLNRRIHRVVVIDSREGGSRPVGVIASSDLVRLMVAEL